MPAHLRSSRLVGFVRWIAAAAIAIGPGCGARSGLVLGEDPDGLDAGLRRDAPGLDAPGRDAPGLDAPGPDAPAVERDTPASDGPIIERDTAADDAPLLPSDAPAPDAPLVDRDAGPPDAPVASIVGCADGAREGFRDTTRFARIAACGGGFALPGVLVEEAPACGRAGGDDGMRPGGEGCRAVDLCAAGWHVCRSAGEVAAASPGGCAGLGDVPSAFFATAQSGPGCGLCAVGTRTCAFAECAPGCAPDRRAGSSMANDVFGCGTLGDTPDPSCGPLDRFSANACDALDAPWRCAATSGFDEALVIAKPGPDRGGVLCCRDDVTE